MKLKFNWDAFSTTDFEECLKHSHDECYDGAFMGAVRVGNLCFDLRMVQLEHDDPLYMCYDLYVGGIDDGYGYGIDDYPYTEADGGCFPCECYNLTYHEFKTMAEAKFTDYIFNEYKTYNLIQKASESLKVW